MRSRTVVLAIILAVAPLLMAERGISVQSESGPVSEEVIVSYLAKINPLLLRSQDLVEGAKTREVRAIHVVSAYVHSHQAEQLYDSKTLEVLRRTFHVDDPKTESPREHPSSPGGEVFLRVAEGPAITYDTSLNDCFGAPSAYQESVNRAESALIHCLITRDADVRAAILRSGLDPDEVAARILHG